MGGKKTAGPPRWGTRGTWLRPGWDLLVIWSGAPAGLVATWLGPPGLLEAWLRPVRDLMETWVGTPGPPRGQVASRVGIPLDVGRCGPWVRRWLRPSGPLARRVWIFMMSNSHFGLRGWEKNRGSPPVGDPRARFGTLGVCSGAPEGLLATWLGAPGPPRRVEMRSQEARSKSLGGSKEVLGGLGRAQVFTSFLHSRLSFARPGWGLLGTS